MKDKDQNYTFFAYTFLDNPYNGKENIALVITSDFYKEAYTASPIY